MLKEKANLLPAHSRESESLFDFSEQISFFIRLGRFLSQQFVTWRLRSISKAKIVKFFCLCMSEHMIYIINVTNVTKTLHQNVTNVTKLGISSKEI